MLICMDLDAILMRKLAQMFPDAAVRARAEAALARYGTQSHEQEPARVRLAVLKLAGADLADIERTTETAKQDFRDVLSWAEYPRQSKRWSMPEGPKKQALREADRADHEAWLKQ